MSEPGITPLAQRLAEENNVDWRSLAGSGDDGTIVERDVLEYLARVMAGEEALDPTPEPLPEGMDAWPEADGWAGQQPQDGAEPAQDDSLSWAGEDDANDFGTPVAFDAEQAELRASGEWPAADDPFSQQLLSGPDAGFSDEDDDFDLSEDIFLFDDGDEDDGFAADDEELLLADPEETADPGGQAAEYGLHQDEFADLAEDTLFLSDEPSQPAEEAGHLSEAGFGQELLTGALQQPGQEEDSVPGPADDGLLGDEQFEDADLDDLAALDGELDDPALADEGLREFERGFSMDSLEQQSEAGSGSAPDAAEDSGLFGQDSDRFELEQETGSLELNGSEFDVDFSEAEHAAADGWQDGVELAGELHDSADDDEAESLARRIEAAFESVADARPEFEGFGDELESALPGAAAGTTSLPLADFGKLLRRQLDVSELTRAQKVVDSEIDGAGSAAASAFLLLAAQRAARETGFGHVGPAVAVLQGDRLELTSQQQAGTGFRELLQRLLDITDGDLPGDVTLGEAGFVVADLSGLEVDEAVLDLGVPVLSLGRIVRDEERSELRSTLTLSGGFDLQDGARFLQAVSELLASPLRLLL